MSRCPHCGSVHDALNHFCPVTGQTLELGPRLIGQTLLAKYRVITILGQGPIGIVLEVEKKNSPEHYAAKLIHPQYTRGLHTTDKMLSEARTSATIANEHLAKVIDCGRDVGGALVVVRELMTGECLQTRLDGQTRFSFEEATSIGLGIARGLDALHQKRLLNLDLSPTDVFLARVNNRMVPKIVDLGEHWIKSKLPADLLDEVESRHYWAPEQFSKSTVAGPRADVYAAGAVLFHILTGRAPRRPLDQLTTVAPHVPNALAQVIEKATAHNPENRHQSAAELAAELVATLAPSMSHPRRSTPSPIPVKHISPQTKPSVPPKKSSKPPVEPKPSSPPQKTPSKPPAEQRTSSPPPKSSKPPAELRNSAPIPVPPSVIIDMPEMHNLSGGKSNKLTLGIFAGVLVAVIGSAMYLIGPCSSVAPSEQEPSPAKPQQIEIRVEVDPANAAVYIDGMLVNSRPPVIETEPDGKLHTIGAKAEGYEPRERDVRFDSSKTVKLSLTEIVKPDDERSATPGTQPSSEASPKAPVDPRPNNAVREKPSQTRSPVQEENNNKAKADKQKTKKPRTNKTRPEKKPSSSGKKTKDGFSMDNPFN